jgi:lactate dehydrogenase-like 2-hydroxyacid dehydrogenase
VKTVGSVWSFGYETWGNRSSENSGEANMNATKKTAQILVTRKLHEVAEKRLASSYSCIFNKEDKSLTSNDIIDLAAGCDGIVTTSFDKFPADVMAALPASIKVIATVSVGHEHLDKPTALSRGITLTNTPDVLTDATADISMLLILGAARGAAWGDRMVRENRWPRGQIIAPMGHDVSRKRLGILGMGRIGQAVAQRAKGFDMALHYHNRRPAVEADRLGATYHATFDAMLPHCDFLSINCPMTPETAGLINARTLALLPNGAIVVNTARGGIVVDDDLIAALESGHIAAAGLDVFANEPNIDPRYRTLENVFMLPHLGSATHGTRTAMAMRAIDNIDAFFHDKRPRDIVT